MIGRFMGRKSFFSVNEFAKFSRTTRHTLRYYDKIGLLSPVSRGGNDYRYYNSRQVADINLIRTFQTLGMTLEEIKNIHNKRAPGFTSELFARQIDKIDEKISEWVRAKKLLYTLQTSISSAMSVDEQEITIQFLPAEAVIFGEINDYSRGRDDYDALFTFYQTMSKKYHGLDMNYPVWGVFSEERIKRGDWTWPDRYYFYNHDGYDRRPAALYAIGYARGGYGHSDVLYKRIVEYIDKNGFEVCGDAYEEYPLNEICVANENNYLLRVMVTVQEKGKQPSSR